MLKGIAKILITFFLCITTFAMSKTEIEARNEYPSFVWNPSGEFVESHHYKFPEGTSISGNINILVGTARSQRIHSYVSKKTNNGYYIDSEWDLTVYTGSAVYERNFSFDSSYFDVGSYQFELVGQYYNTNSGEWVSSPYSDIFYIDVYKVPAASSISLSKTNINIVVGSGASLSATVSPSSASQEVTWSSSNKSIATVDSKGNVSAKKAGTATITAKTSNGKSASCKVKVLFTDVPASGVYYSAPVYWAVDKGITAGFKDGDGLSRTFGPQLNCTRAQVVTFLWRLACKPEPSSMTSKFLDVQDSSLYYYKAVLWAAQKGITGGYKDGTFKPDDTCLREHVVTFLWRYANKPSPKTSSNPFNDIQPYDYYYSAAVWASENGIAKGYSEGEYAGGFGPKLDCLREHVVTFLYRYAK